MTLFEATTIPADAVYLEYRDCPDRESERAYLEELWHIFRDYADPDFREQLCHDFLGRFWEMVLGVFLTRNGVQLLPRTSAAGPDFRINGPSPISIEAVAPDSGRGADRVPSLNEVVGHRSLGKKPNDEITLRVRAVINDKVEQYVTRRNKGVVAADESYVIAINPLKIGSVAIDTDPPHLLRATLGLGEPIAYLERGEEEVELKNTHRPVIYKRNLSPVETDIFLNHSHAAISAILMSFAKPEHRNMDPDVKLLHNPYALNCLPRDLFPRATEYWIEGDDLIERPPNAS